MHFLLFYILLILPYCVNAQVEDKEYQTIIDGIPVIVQIRNGDTTIFAELEKAVVKPVKFYTEQKEQERYLKYKRYAAVVYPYAVHAVRLYNQLQTATNGQSEKERRKFVKNISYTLEEEFEKPLKNLTKTQGFLLTKMIERELDKPFYSIIKELKGGFTAFYWNQLGKMNGYKLKDQYHAGDDELLDSVLEEFDLKKDLN
ncbi:MAG: DUF4294 domain-containing protein [Saprospiraceae bacterium]